MLNDLGKRKLSQTFRDLLAVNMFAAEKRIRRGFSITFYDLKLLIMVLNAERYAQNVLGTIVKTSSVNPDRIRNVFERLM